METTSSNAARQKRQNLWQAPNVKKRPTYQKEKTSEWMSESIVVDYTLIVLSNFDSSSGHRLSAGYVEQSISVDGMNWLWAAYRRLPACPGDSETAEGACT